VERTHVVEEVAFQSDIRPKIVVDTNIADLPLKDDSDQGVRLTHYFGYRVYFYHKYKKETPYITHTRGNIWICSYYEKMGIMKDIEHIRLRKYVGDLPGLQHLP
jgi:hypothetical protein